MSFEVSGGKDLEGFTGNPISIDSFNNFPLDKKVQAVLVALDQSFTYTKLCLASLYVSAGQARMICTNNDKNIVLNGQFYPGTGSIVDAIQVTLNNEYGSQLDHEPEFAGMPNPFIFDLIERDHDVSGRGDMCLLASSEKDLELSERSGITTCWIGKTGDLDKLPNRHVVDYLLP